MENTRMNHPSPITTKTIGEMTFSEFYLSVVNSEFNYKEDSYRIYGFKMMGKNADTTTFFVKNNNTQEQYEIEAEIKENEYITSLKASMIHKIAELDSNRQYELPEYHSWVGAYSTFINSLHNNN